MAVESWRDRSASSAWVFLTPSLILFVLFFLLPSLWVLWLSVQERSLLGSEGFVGLANYAALATEPEFWLALTHTLWYTAVTVPLGLAGGLALALLLHRPLPGRTFFRAAHYLPHVISGVATGLLAAWLFNDYYGVLNAILERMGLGRVPWLTSPAYAMPAIIATTLWTRVGFCMVVYLAGLQDIPAELYDAAKLDGATGWRQIRFVTLPQLWPTTFFLLVTNVIGSFQVFDLIYVMTGGGPAYATTVLVQHIYEAGFETQRLGYAAAASVVLYLIILLLTLLLWRQRRRSWA